MSITRFNNDNVRFDFEPKEDFEYRTLEDLYNENGKNKTYLVKGVFVNTKSRYGDSAVAVSEDCFINLPSHLVDTVREIREDVKLVEDINNDKIGFKIYEYFQRKYNKTCYSINWVEL